MMKKIVIFPLLCLAVFITQSKVFAVEKEADFTNSIGMKLVYVPKGSFTMGSPKNERGRDTDEVEHRVTFTKGFWIQSTEVTQGQWKAVMGSNPSHFADCGGNCPVEMVSWKDAQEFIKKLSEKEGRQYRLPTEAEWEYAARAGTTTAFAFGNCLTTYQANYDGLETLAGCQRDRGGYNFIHRTIAAGTYKPNGWGLYDMHGNVWEWCQDWLGDYSSGPVIDPVGPSSGKYPVVRGGAWNQFVKTCRSAVRGYADNRDARADNTGLRLVLTAKD